MTKFVLTFLILAITTLQVALIMNYYCNTPKCISYKIWWLHHVGDRVYLNCDNGNGIYGSLSASLSIAGISDAPTGPINHLFADVTIFT